LIFPFPSLLVVNLVAYASRLPACFDFSQPLFACHLPPAPFLRPPLVVLLVRLLPAPLLLLPVLPLVSFWRLPPLPLFSLPPQFLSSAFLLLPVPPLPASSWPLLLLPAASSYLLLPLVVFAWLLPLLLLLLLLLASIICRWNEKVP
jgi:hypothetical protein